MKNKTSRRALRRKRIKGHIRKHINGSPERPRLAVFRSLKAIQAQLIDDSRNQTLITISSNSKALADEIKKANGKVEAAKIVGRVIGEEAKKHKIKTVVFDRSGYLYHGRVKALADAAREAGLKF